MHMKGQECALAYTQHPVVATTEQGPCKLSMSSLGIYPSPMIFPIQGIVHVMEETHIVVDITHAVCEFERATVSVSEVKDTIIKTKDNLRH